MLDKDLKDDHKTQQRWEDHTKQNPPDRLISRPEARSVPGQRSESHEIQQNVYSSH